MSDQTSPQNEEPQMLSAEGQLPLFGDEVLLNQLRELNYAIDALPGSVHATNLHTLVYDALIALTTLQQTGNYIWPQPQFQPLKETLAEPPLAPVATVIVAELVDAVVETVEEVPSMQVLAARFHQALVTAGVKKIDFPDINPQQRDAIDYNLENFLKDPKVNTNEPFLIPDPNDPDHLFKVSFDGFKIIVESTLSVKKTDQPLTPVEVLSNPINSLPIMAFFSMQELLTPPPLKAMVYNASYPSMDGQAPSIFDKAHLVKNNPQRRSTDITGSVKV